MELQDTTVLVTGATGFVGGRVTARLVAAGARVRAIVRRLDEVAVDDVEEIQGDFTDPDDLRAALDGVDAVVHCAAGVGPTLDAARAVNTAGTRTVVEAMAHAGVDRLVHISTTSVYVRTGATITEECPLVTEGSPYSVTKAEAEGVVRAAGPAGATVLRPPAILGWSPTSTWGQKLPARIATGELPFTPTPTETLPWVHVDDLADVVVLTLTDARAAGRTYDVIGGNATWRGYVDAVLGFVDADADPFDGDDAPADPWTGTFPGRRLRDELGWEPRRTFDDGMAEAAAGYRAP